jgi:hypothetical protein
VGESVFAVRKGEIRIRTGEEASISKPPLN